MLLEHAQRPVLTLLIAGRAGQDHEVPSLTRSSLDPAGELGEERVVEVECHQRDRLALDPAQKPRGMVADVPELLDCLEHSGASLLGHDLRAVEDVRDRPDRDRGALSDVANRQALHALTLYTGL